MTDNKTVRTPSTPRLRLVAVAAAVTGSLLVMSTGASAILASGSRNTDEVTATLDFKRVQGAARFCDGRDGTYDQERGVVSGIASGDPRLSGRIALRFRSLDRLTDEGHLGTFRGRLRVFNPSTGRMKLNSRVHLVQHYGDQVGVLVGTTADGSSIVANVRIRFTEVNGNFDIVGQVGGQSDSKTMPAVVQRGKCSGPYEPYAFDLP